MYILSEKNTIIDTDVVEKRFHFSVLSFKDYKNPDFYFENPSQLEHFESASICLEIGPYKLVMPLHWSILVTDYDQVESLPLYEICGRDYQVFAMNPIDGYMPRYLPLKTGAIYRNTNWTSPPVSDKDMLVVPLGYEIQKDDDQRAAPGPICAIFSPSKLEISKSISEIW